MPLFGPRHRDGDLIALEGLDLRLRVNPRARRISLRLDPATGEALAVAPSAARLGDAVRFARERGDWLAAQLARRPRPQPLSPGATLAVLGETWRLVPDGRRPHLAGPAPDGVRTLRGCGAEAVDPGLVRRVVKREALDVFVARAERHCRSLGLTEAPPLSLIDARTRWGSCTPAQAGREARIRLSWRLALAPLAVADYVVAHECAHLREANHGPAFWRLVRDLVGDERPSRAWLREHGLALKAQLPLT
ncbi:MAG: M48 family metallopeptidase [Alphaproteobacteria bacterium]|nr:M48 family metallopeptidase [Alphaproteobacteria bacterium]